MHLIKLVMKQINNVMEEIKKIIDKTEFDGKDITVYKETVYKRIEKMFNKHVIIDKKISESAKQI